MKKQDKYHKSIPARVKFLIVEASLLNSHGQIAWVKIAKSLGVSISTLRRWRDPLSEYYHKSFAKAVTEAQEAIDAGSIKRSMIIRAQGFTQRKITKEPKLTGLIRPPLSSMNKPELVKFAKKKLKLRIKEKMTKSQLILAIDETLEKATKEVMAVTKKETTTMAGDVQAAKLVLGNIGPEDERWKEKAELELTVPVGVTFNIKKNYDSDKDKKHN